MECPVCKRSMAALFTSMVCEHCKHGPKGPVYRGYILWAEEAANQPRYVCVFQHEVDAAAWLAMHGATHPGNKVHAVGSLDPYQWTIFKHSKLGDVRHANHGFQVFLNHRYEPKPYRCFLIR